MARQEITRLGEGVDSRRRLLPLPIARVRNVLTDYRREAERLGAERTLLVATSAVRDAENGEAFLGEIEWSYGFTTQLLGGEDEAELTFRGVTSDRRLERPTLVLDIGGGSTELVVAGPAGVHSRYSIDIGSVRLTERFLRGDPPSASRARRLRRACRGLDPRGSRRRRRDRRRGDDHQPGRDRPRHGGVRPRPDPRPPPDARGDRARGGAPVAHAADGARTA